MTAKSGAVNMKYLLSELDRYLAFCHQQNKPVQRVALTPRQYAEFMRVRGEAKYYGVEIVSQ